MWRHRFILVVLDDQLQHHKKKLNALKHLTSGRKIVQFIDFWASILGLVGDTMTASYNASKGAVRLFSKSAAVYAAQNDLNIRVNTVHPGLHRNAIDWWIRWRWLSCTIRDTTFEDTNGTHGWAWWHRLDLRILGIRRIKIRHWCRVRHRRWIHSSIIYYERTRKFGYEFAGSFWHATAVSIVQLEHQLYSRLTL